MNVCNEELKEPLKFDFSTEQYTVQFMNNLLCLRNNSRFCDVKIVVQNKVFNAHRIVLSSSSKYFYAMFNNELIENEKDTVELHSISSCIFNILLDFMYTGKIQITRCNAQELIVAADMLMLMHLIDACVEFFKKELDVTNSVGIYRFADQHGLTDLAKEALKFIQDNFPHISLEEEFLELPKKYITDLLSSEYLHVENEVQVFQSAMRWIYYKVDERRSFISEILCNIRLSLLAKSVIEQAILECSDESIKLNLRSVWKDLFFKKDSLSPPLVAQPRLCAKRNIFVIGGSKSVRSSYGILKTIEKFDTFKKSWTEVSPMAIRRIMPGVTTLNGKIFVVGGEQESKILANGECYNPISDMWNKIDSMVIPRCEFGLVTLYGYLYAVGGYVGQNIDGSIERYDPVLNKWMMLPHKLPESVLGMGIVSYDGLIYIVGGCNGQRHSSLISFNPVTGEWETLAPMLVPRSHMGVAVLDSHLYVVGGTSKYSLYSVEKYSFCKNKWYKVPQMAVKRCGPAVVAVDGLLYVIGGNQPQDSGWISVSSVEQFDPVTETWKESPPLLDSRSEAGVIVV